MSNTKIINKKTKLQFWAKWWNKLNNILQKSNYDNTKNNSKKWLTGKYNSVQKQKTNKVLEKQEIAWQKLSKIVNATWSMNSIKA